MSDRGHWFRIEMGQDEVTKLIPNNADGRQPQLPTAFPEGLSLDLKLNG